MNRFMAVPLTLLAIAACSDTDGPDDHELARTTHLVQYQSCNQLEADLKQMTKWEIYADIDQADHWGYGVGGAEGDSAGGGASPTNGGGRQEGVDFSGTNNQE